MSINYSVGNITLGGKPKCIGRIVTKETYDTKKLVSRMCAMGTSLSKEDIEGALSLFEKAVYTICLEGNKVTLDGFVHFTPAISGTFDGNNGGFDRNTNNVYLTSYISTTTNKAFSRDAHVEKITSAERKPRLFEVRDTDTKEINTTATKNNIITIRGEKLKYDASMPDEYLRFVNAADPLQFAAIGACQKSTGGEIVFLMPNVPFSCGYFEIASRMHSRTIRIGRSPTVTVA
jgi:hypothetical protein